MISILERLSRQDEPAECKWSRVAEMGLIGLERMEGHRGNRTATVVALYGDGCIGKVLRWAMVAREVARRSHEQTKITALQEETRRRNENVEICKVNTLQLA
jgi:hypothetical protein